MGYFTHCDYEENEYLPKRDEAPMPGMGLHPIVMVVIARNENGE
jgi:hypothetical protein